MKTLVLFGSILVFAGLSSASIVPNATPPTPTVTADSMVGVYDWSYNFLLQGDQRLDPAATSGKTCNAQQCNPAGTFFTIYGFAGFQGFGTGALAPPSGWTATSQSIGITPFALKDFSLPGQVNLTFTYTGPVLSGPLNLGNFVAKSIYNTPVAGNFNAQATRNGGPLDGQTVNNYNVLSVPLGVPEPASMLLIGGGLIALAAFRRKLVL